MERTVKLLIMEENKAFLPDDIIVNILKGLPVKSLIRFQSVCKHWKNLFKSPSFIADHLHHSSYQNPSLLLRWHHFGSSNFQLSLLDCNMQLVEVHNAPLIDFLSVVRIYGSCNGLLCLELVDGSRSSRFILLWNPATRQVRKLPITTNDFKGLCRVGFGFSPIVNDYKIMMFYVLKNGDSQLSRKKMRVMAWFGDEDDDDYEDDDYCYIVSFDLSNDDLTLIPMPDVGFCKRQMLTVYESKLALLCHKHTKAFNWLELWVMEEDGTGTSRERWSWTEKYCTSYFAGLSCSYPMTVWGNQVVYEAEPAFESEDEINGETKFVLNLSDAITDEFKKITFPRYSEGHTIYNYAESLVSVVNF
ncbi:F-box protein At3g07870-like [Prosopis cineraria]|uniref:F-box protein At3g07870-like n=1 Tax=Prosopis cineraria TaxID=364024 RepID=UPI002410AE0C|nr:F-box protein At3g07870-like [Prosopis cineraria]